MGIQDFDRTIVPETAVMRAIRVESKRKGTHKLMMKQISQEIAAYRRGKRTRNVQTKARP